MKLPEYNDLILDIDRFQKTIQDKRKVFEHYDHDVLNASVVFAISMFPKPLNKIVELVYTGSSDNSSDGINTTIEFLDHLKVLGKDQYDKRKQRLNDYLPFFSGTDYDPIIGEKWKREKVLLHLKNILSTSDEKLILVDINTIHSLTVPLPFFCP